MKNPGLAEASRGAGRLRARVAANEADRAATLALRHLCFIEAAGRTGRPDRLETDSFDDLCRHVLIEEAATGRLVCSYRVLALGSGAEMERSYSAQYYDLAQMASYPLPMIEVGRFCMRPGLRDADALRLAWGTLVRMVDGAGAGMLFGCSSFAGTEPADFAAALALLWASHRAPDAIAPRVRAPEHVRLDSLRPCDRRHPLSDMPPLLRTYLGMGGWVSDHAVIDRKLGTLHVFTGVEVAAIPPARARLLRALAAQSGPPVGP